MFKSKYFSVTFAQIRVVTLTTSTLQYYEAVHGKDLPSRLCDDQTSAECSGSGSLPSVILVPLLVRVTL